MFLDIRPLEMEFFGKIFGDKQKKKKIIFRFLWESFQKLQMGIFFKRATGVTCRVYIAFQLVEFRSKSLFSTKYMCYDFNAPAE